jgi:hydroxyacylglutathione hydrolase
MSTAEHQAWHGLTFVPRRPPRRSIPALHPAAIGRAAREGAVLVDGRSPEAYDACHIPGSVCLPLHGGDFDVRARWVIEADLPVVAVAEGDVDTRSMARALTRAGFRVVASVLEGGVLVYRRAGYAVGSQPAAPADRLLEDLQLGGAVLVDARDDDEWLEGHVPGSVHLPLRSLAGPPAHLPSAPVVCACGDGRRAATAASVLRCAGHDNVWRIAGAGLPYLLSRRLDLRGA